MRKLLVCAIALCCVLPLIGLAEEVVSEDPLERQTLDIAKDLRCAVCQNEPVSESRSDLAADMRRIIREKLEAGESREEIINFFVARYGNYVLLKPPYQGTGTLVWVAPLVLLAVLAISAFVYMRNRTRRPPPPPPSISADDLARVRAAREIDQEADQ